MFIYIALFLISTVLGIILTGKNPTKAKKIIYLTIAFGLMYLITVFRYGMGNDYFSYMRITEQLRGTGFLEAFTLGHEPLYVLLIKLFLGLNLSNEIIYAILAVLILFPVAFSIYRHSDNVWISVSVYLCLTFFYTQLSFIRQSLAVSVLILAYGFMKKRKVVPVLILAVIATLFHFTAAVFIPLYLLSLIKPTKKYLIIYSSVSVGVLVTCLIMKAVGANPLNLVAKLVTAVTGRDYTSYISTNWFEMGFGPQYLIMPLAVLALVMISYFLGWKEKEEAPMLLQLTLMNASIWSFITYAYIIERFSMFIFIFSVFTIPSVLTYYADKAAEAEKKAAEASNGKKLPGYSKKQTEDKKDNSFLLTTVSVVCMFIYNCWSLGMNFHGVNPYMVMFPEVQDAIDGLDTSEENLEVLVSNADLYTAFIQLKNIDNSYAIVSTSNNYNGITKAVRNAADYAGTSFNRPSDVEAKTPAYTEYNNRNGEISADSLNYTSKSGVTIINDGVNATVTDKTGKSIVIADNLVVLVFFDSDGEIISALKYTVNHYGRYAKISLPQ